MKYCQHCGNEVFDNAIICPKCGCSVAYNNNSYGHTPVQTDYYTVLSIVGFVLSFFQCVIGLVISIIAYNDAKKSGNSKSMTLSKAGIAVSAVLMGLAVLVIVLYIVFIVIAIGSSYYYW